MAELTTINLAHLPPPHNTLYLALFTDLENGAFLRQQLIEGNTNFEYAFIDASTIVSTTHLVAACFRAVNDMHNQRLRSRNVHSEIVFSLGTNNNIATSLKNFGVDVTTKHLLAIKVSKTLPSDVPDEYEVIKQHLQQHVKGRPLPCDNDSIPHLTNWEKVRKLYKLPQDSGASKLEEAEATIMGLIALRGS